MKSLRYILSAITIATAALAAVAQDTSSSASAPVRRRTDRDRKEASATPGVTGRMQDFYSADNTSLSDADLQWMRVIYRQIDLEKDKNAPLYFPEEPVDGQENLFRIIMRLLADGNLKAYEYLDGREIFTEKYQSSVKDILDRFYIIYTPAKGSTEKNPRFTIDEADVPANEVLSYYIIEKWVYDTRNNRLRPSVEAICPVLHRAGDFGGDAIRYPMFWVKYSDLRPHLLTRSVFMTDDNNLPTGTYDDYFTLGRYDGEIYKTRNLRNLSMAQMYPEPEARKQAQDSIQATLDNFNKKLWVPSLDELTAAREAREAAAAPDSATTAQESAKPSRSRSARAAAKKSSKTTKARKAKKEPKAKPAASSTATRSVRNRRK